MIAELFGAGIIAGVAFITLIAVMFFIFKKRLNKRRKLTPHMAEFPQVMGSAISRSKALLSSADYLYAVDNGALAATWHKSKSICEIPEHEQMDLKTYTIRNSWAIKKGLVRAGNSGFLDEINLPRCGCHLTYLYNIQSLPTEILTKKYLKTKEKST